MKKITLMVFALVMGAITLQSCEDLDDNAVPVNDFIWKGLNLYYLWQADVPNLADDKFKDQAQLNSFLESYSSPNTLFADLLYKRGEVDRFSVLFSDYRVLENALQGVSKSNGAEFGLLYTDASQTNVFGYVRYVLPNSDADNEGVKRGDIFYAVNNTQLNASNYQSLLGNESYTLNLADYNNSVITPNGRNVSLTKKEYAENPVLVNTTYTSGSHKIGYLMYNGFYSNYDSELNAAFGKLKSDGVTDLVLDLRYNGGGSVRTATYLASMITGQFSGQLFAKEQWNAKLEKYYQENNPDALQDLFTDKFANGSAVNSLNLNKVYVITTGSTASASELVINCLKPYIEVVQIGTTTVGKNVGSVTLYDSPNFSSKGRSGSHRYAMQPIVLKVINKDGFGDYTGGLDPTIRLEEDYGNLGVLGDPAEPLYAAALANITAAGRQQLRQPSNSHKLFKDSKNMRRFGTEMYRDDMPDGSLGLIKTLQ